MQHVGDERAGDAVRVDAEVPVEAAVLDGDEGLRQISRHFLQRQHRAAHVAARGEHVTVVADDLDRGRALGNFQRLDRRQMRADIGDGAGAADRGPQAEHQAPIDDAAGERAAASAFARFAFGLRRARRRGARTARCRPVARRDAQLRRAVEHRLPARARFSSSLRHHATRPTQPAALPAAPEGTLEAPI